MVAPWIAEGARSLRKPVTTVLGAFLHEKEVLS